MTDEPTLSSQYRQTTLLREASQFLGLTSVRFAESWRERRDYKNAAGWYQRAFERYHEAVQLEPDLALNYRNRYAAARCAGEIWDCRKKASPPLPNPEELVPQAIELLEVVKAHPEAIKDRKEYDVIVSLLAKLEAIKERAP